ncbi:hypothetical protein OIU91_06310 [Streptomyces sp. NBC_01456]|uniref:hypothetical protein n=1 Tax=Streptomyces sp. NBC_01456 TaxID=2975868 RepID=UPI002E34743B|nr:hypothetical protein [Streptomyces sp. NBC_01456]
MRDTIRRLLAALTHSGPGYAPHDSQAVQMQTALGLLSDRYLEVADRATTEVGKGRAMQIRQAGNDIRHTLITGRIPAYLMTDAELDALTQIEPAESADKHTAQ